MFDLDKWSEILQALTKNPLRTMLTALGVFWGIFMLVIMLGSGKGLENGVQAGFSGMATNSVFIWTQRTSKAYMGLPPGRGFNMNNDDFTALKRNITEARIIAPRNQLGGHMGSNNVARGNKDGAFSVMGDYPAIQYVESVWLLNGRFLNQLDLADRRKVAVIGTKVKEILFEKEEDPIGEYIRINGVYFKVIGVFRTRQTGDRAERDTQKIYVPFSTFQTAFNYGNFVSWFAITSHDDIPVSVAEEKAIALLKKRHKISPEDDRAFGHFNLQERYDQIQGLFLGINGLSWFVGICTLLAGVIGVSNIMLVIVKERTKEIGIRRAIGAKPVAIVSQIISESVVLTSVAGFMGLFVGVVLLAAIGSILPSPEEAENVMFLNPEVHINTALWALGVMVVSGAFAGLIPAQRALSISPVDALRAD